MTNAKGENLEFDKLKPMLQNDKRNSFHWVLHRRRTRDENNYPIMYHESNIHSSVYCFSHKIIRQVLQKKCRKLRPKTRDLKLFKTQANGNEKTKHLLAGYSTLTMLCYNFIINDKKKTNWHNFVNSKTYDICKTEYILCLFFVLTGMIFSVALLPCLLLSRKTTVSSCTASYSVQGQILQNHTFKTQTA